MKKIPDPQLTDVQDEVRLWEYLGHLVRAMVTGTRTNDAAGVGEIGECLSASVENASKQALTAVTPKNITSIALTRGDWDVSGVVYSTGDVATTVNYLAMSISLTSATFDLTPGRFASEWYSGGTIFFGSGLISQGVGPYRFSVDVATTIYLIAQADFAVNSLSAYGYIQARRMR